MVDDAEQFVHVLLHFPGSFDGLLGEVLDGGQLLLACFDFLIHVIRLAGDADDGIGQLLMLVAGSPHSRAENGLRGIRHLLGDVDDFVRLMLHGQIQRADLHDRFDIFLEQLRELLPPAGQPFVDAIQLRLRGVVGCFQLRDSLHQYFFLFSNGHIFSLFL